MSPFLVWTVVGTRTTLAWVRRVYVGSAGAGGGCSGACAMAATAQDRVRRRTEKKARMGQVYLEVRVEIFRVFARRKMFCGGVAFLLVIFQFLVCFVMVNRGAFVVDCVVNVVS